MRPIRSAGVWRTEAERTTIGALLVDPDRIIDVAPAIQPKDFYDPTYRAIYAAIRELYEDRKPIDFVTVAELLRTDEKIQSLGGSAFLATLAANVPTAAHAAHYASIIRDKSMQRPRADPCRPSIFVRLANTDAETPRKRITLTGF